MLKSQSVFCFTLIFLLLTGATLHAQYTHLLHKTYAERSDSLINFYDHILPFSDSADVFNRIDAIEKLAEENNDRDLLLEAKLMRAHYFCYRPYPREQISKELEELIDLGQKENALWLETRAEAISGIYYFSTIHEYELGFFHFEKAYRLLQKQTPEQFPQKQACLYLMGDAYYKFAEYEKALAFYREAFQATSKYDRKRYVMHSLNTTGLCYQHLQMPDSSGFYFQLVYENAVAASDTEWIGIALGNIGYNHFLRKEYKQAIPLFEEDIIIAEKYKDWGLAAGSLIPLAAINLEQKNISLAETQLLKAKQYIEQSGQYKRLEKLYPLLSKLYAAKGEAELSAVYLDSALNVKDSLARRFSLLRMTRAQQKLQIEQHESDMELLAAQQQLKILQRNVLMGIVILLAIATVMIYRNWKKKYAHKQEELDDAEAKLAQARKQLLAFAKSIADKNLQLEQLRSQAGSDAGLQKTPGLIELYETVILTKEQWLHFKELFEKAYPAFFQRLKLKCLTLTPAEERFVALSKLNIPPNEMAAILGIGKDTIRQHRSRLKKKLNISGEGELEKWIEEI